MEGRKGDELVVRGEANELPLPARMRPVPVPVPVRPPEHVEVDGADHATFVSAITQDVALDQGLSSRGPVSQAVASLDKAEGDEKEGNEASKATIARAQLEQNEAALMEKVASAHARLPPPSGNSNNEDNKDRKLKAQLRQNEAAIFNKGDHAMVSGTNRRDPIKKKAPPPPPPQKELATEQIRQDNEAAACETEDNDDSNRLTESQEDLEQQEADILEKTACLPPPGNRQDDTIDSKLRAAILNGMVACSDLERSKDASTSREDNRKMPAVQHEVTKASPSVSTFPDDHLSSLPYTETGLMSFSENPTGDTAAPSFPGAYPVVGSSDIWHRFHLRNSSAPAQPSNEGAANNDTNNNDNDVEAVATLIDEEDGRPKQIATPASNNGSGTSHKFDRVAIGVIVFFLALTLLVGSMCGGGLICDFSDDDKSNINTATQPPTLAWNAQPRYVQIQAMLTMALGDHYFDINVLEQNTPNGTQAQAILRRRALYWMVHEDPSPLSPNDESLLQRFVLVLFYYQTTRQRPWLACNPPTIEEPETTCTDPATFTLESEQSGSRWLTGATECQWNGVSCDDNGKAQILQLMDNDLHGSIPTELAMLSHLTRIRLSGNNLSGSIPTASLVGLSSLEYYQVEKNQISGTLPLALFQMKQNLTAISLGYNLISGTIPTEAGLFSGRTLHFRDNRLSGSLPTELFGISSLVFLALKNNQLTGTIPTLVGDTDLAHLSFANNSFHGTIPPEAGEMSSLRTIDLAGNKKLGGTLPEELFTGPASSSIATMALDRCNFSGTISAAIGRLTNLKTFTIVDNNFHGSIPEELVVVPMLETIHVSGNDFSGSVPNDICLGFNRSEPLLSVSADCSPDADSGIPATPCRCCTECCDRRTGICEEV